MHRLIGGIVVAITSGCLSVPPPAMSQDAEVDAPSADAGNPFPCGAPADFNPQSFPPGGMQIGIRDIIASDVNGDGAIDLIITNAEVANTDYYGFFVLLGPQTDPFALQYHAWVPTNVAPWAVAAANLDDGVCQDILVFGANKAGNAGYVEAYRQNATSHAFDAPLTKDVGFVPQGESAPVKLVLGDFDGDGARFDLMVSDLTQLRLLKTGDNLFENLPTAVPVDVGPSGAPGNWTDINGLFARPSVGTGLTSDDLVVIEQTSLTWLRNDGDGNFGNPVTASSTGQFVSRGIGEVDLDGVPPLDFIGGAGDGFGAYLLSQSGETITIETRPWNGVVGVSNQLDDLYVADLGGAGRPEVVVLETDEPSLTNPAFAALINDVIDADTELTPTTVVRFSFESAGIHPGRGVVADFNDDGAIELWVFDRQGASRCLRRRAANPELEFCN